MWPGRAHECGQVGRMGVARQGAWVWLGRAYGDVGDCDRGFIKASPMT